MVKVITNLFFVLTALFTSVGITSAQPAVKPVYKSADEKPVPPFDLSKYLSAQLHYPKEAMQKNIQGRVMVKFMVMETGAIRYPEVISAPLGGGLEKEALRVIAAMPKWKPGKKQGKIVRVYYSQPIDFYLDAAHPKK